MPEISKVKTPLSEANLCLVLHNAHVNTLGGYPTLERLACAWAHVAHENARGAAIWCNNFGNISAFGGWSGDYYVILCDEQQAPGVWMTVAMRFRAHPTPDQGAGDYWTRMVKQWPVTLERFDAGDPAGAAHALKVGRFYTANEGPYATDMTKLYQRGLDIVRASGVALAPSSGSGGGLSSGPGLAVLVGGAIWAAVKLAGHFGRFYG